MTITELSNDEAVIYKSNPVSIESFFYYLKQELMDNHTFIGEKYIDLGIKKVCIKIFDDSIFEKNIDRYLAFCECDGVNQCDSTIVVWKTHLPEKEKKQLKYVMDESYSKTVPILLFDDVSGKIEAYDKANDTHYFGYGKPEPEEITKEGHFLVREFYRILKTPHSSLLHGACFGLNGTGILVCARGMRGKSTLSVSALLRGFEYVADDLMVLNMVDSQLYAYPIYSVIALSPKMYLSMYDDLEGTRFISNNSHRDKYVINIANFHNSFRSKYPIKMCLFPEITNGTEPLIYECNEMEKGCAINQLVHSTISLMDDLGDTSNILKLTNMLKGQQFYKMELCHNIYKNIDFLHSFLLNNSK